MRIQPVFFAPLFLILFFARTLPAQQDQVSSAASNVAASPVPRIIQFSGVLKDGGGAPMSSTTSVTFAIYSEQEGSTALWLETQNVTPDKNGHYIVVLGAASTGVPDSLFTSGQARWLAVRPAGQPEMPRSLLVSVPYALKAGDANTLGGLPPAAFLLANSAAPPVALVSPSFVPATASANSPSPLVTACTTITADGTAPVNLV